MDIKDIVNRELVNPVNCESEPIHIPGSIQPHGFLLALHDHDLIVKYCSENIPAFIGLCPDQVLGKSLNDIFGPATTASFEEYISADTIDTATPFALLYETAEFNVTVHRSGMHLILEAEPLPDGRLDFPNLYHQTSRFLASMEATHQLSELCSDIAKETRAITGYDRVMIYRFDESYNGEVIAESKREDLNSFAGQKYPHTDIPVQARELYIRNPLRMIADIGYAAVPLLTINDGEDKSNKSLDLSLSVLRSVSPIHIEYLKNMGVYATLTISLLLNKKLWGLVACHHYSPKTLPHYRRLSALLQGHFLTSQINVREAAEDLEYAQQAEKILNELLELLFRSPNFLEMHGHNELMLQLTNAEGVIVLYDGEVFKSGTAIEDEQAMSLIRTLHEKQRRLPYHSSCVSKDFEGMQPIAEKVSGVIYYPLSNISEDCILWFRPEKVQMIKWAGNPYDKEESLSPLTPRKSFELWVEQVRLQSLPWKKAELNAAANFAYALEKHNSLRTSRLLEEQYRNLSEDLKAANKELANVNWISTHDLKEPLRKIQIFASMVLDTDAALPDEKVRYSVSRMQIAAKRMQNLIEDILSYSRAGSMEKIFVPTPLADIVKEALEEVQDEVREKNAVITIGDLPLLSVIPFQVRQLFINLAGNALKFSMVGRTPLVNILCDLVKAESVPHPKAGAGTAYYHISVKDNGIGFQQQYAQSIFEVFKRLHSTDEFPGTGIGLAICRKIMENHRGFIDAVSEPGAGTVMNLYFPVAP